MRHEASNSQPPPRPEKSAGEAVDETSFGSHDPLCIDHRGASPDNVNVEEKLK